MEQSIEIGNPAVDIVFRAINLSIAGIALLYAENTPLIHITMPVFLMQFTQWAAWAISCAAGTLAILNFLGYSPGWLTRIKKYLNKKSKP